MALEAVEKKAPPRNLQVRGWCGRSLQRVVTLMCRWESAGVVQVRVAQIAPVARVFGPCAPTCRSNPIWF
jgi:hypothetical protein